MNPIAVKVIGFVIFEFYKFMEEDYKLDWYSHFCHPDGGRITHVTLQRLAILFMEFLAITLSGMARGLY